MLYATTPERVHAYVRLRTCQRRYITLPHLSVVFVDWLSVFELCLLLRMLCAVIKGELDFNVCVCVCLSDSRALSLHVLRFGVDLGLLLFCWLTNCRGGACL